MHFCFRSLVKSTSAEATLSLIVAVTHIAAISVIAQTSPVQNPNMADNPLLSESSLPYHIPPFDKIKDEHFEPAIEAGMREQLKEVEAVAETSKQGFVYLFDRVTGAPLFPIESHKYPPSTVPGEVAAAEQLLPTKPLPMRYA